VFLGGWVAGGSREMRNQAQPRQEKQMQNAKPSIRVSAAASNAIVCPADFEVGNPLIGLKRPPTHVWPLFAQPSHPDSCGCKYLYLCGDTAASNRIIKGFAFGLAIQSLGGRETKGIVSQHISRSR